MSARAKGPRADAPRRPRAGAARVEVAGEEMLLLPQRCALWMRERTLLVADCHWGRCESLGVRGVPMPRGVVEEQLARLGAAVRRTRAERVLVLGDLIHAGDGLVDEMVERIGAWRDALKADVCVVRGNHDRRLDRVAAAWGLRIADGVVHEAPFAFTHEPARIAGAYVWAGHIHPTVRVRGRGDSLRLPAFVVGESAALLPAFCRLTRGAASEAGPAGRVFAVAGDRVIEV